MNVCSIPPNKTGRFQSINLRKKQKSHGNGISTNGTTTTKKINDGKKKTLKRRRKTDGRIDGENGAKGCVNGDSSAKRRENKKPGLERDEINERQCWRSHLKWL